MQTPSGIPAALIKARSATKAAAVYRGLHHACLELTSSLTQHRKRAFVRRANRECKSRPREHEDTQSLEASFLALQMTSGCLQLLKNPTAVCKSTIRHRKGTAKDARPADIEPPILSQTAWDDDLSLAKASAAICLA